MKKISHTLLLSSALFLTACGGGSGSESSSDGKSQEDLSKVQSELKSVQTQQAALSPQLEVAKADLKIKKQNLDALQATEANGGANPEALQNAEREFKEASNKLKELELARVNLENEARTLKEKADTIGAEVELNSFLNNLGQKVLSETFSQSDLSRLERAFMSKTGKQLVQPVNNLIRYFKSELNSGEKLREAFPRVINSPIIDGLLIRLISNYLGDMIQKKAETWIRIWPEDGKFSVIEQGISFSIEYKNSDKSNEYELKFPLKDVVKKYTVYLLQNELSDSEYTAVNRFIDEYFTNNPQQVTETYPLKLADNDPTTLQSDIQRMFLNVKSVLPGVVKKMPEKWMTWFSQLIQQIEEVSEKDMEEYKNIFAELVSQAPTERLSAEAPVSISGNIAHRKARSHTGGLGLAELVVDGRTLDQSYVFDMPLRLDLKGNITSQKTLDVVGSVTYNLKGTVVGVVQSYNNTVDLHAETSVMVSQSVRNFFIEGQAGFVGISQGQFSGWEGQRYQATLGYDAAYASPFVQVEYRPLTNGLSTLDATGVYIGLESDCMVVELPDATFTSSILAKVGYQSTNETMFGKSLKPNQGAAAFVEWTGSLKVSNGFEVMGALKLGSDDRAVQMTVAFDQ